MFYPVDSLKRGGRFYLCWIADSWPSQFEKITHRNQPLWSQDIREICEHLRELMMSESGRPSHRFSLRLSSQLMRGLTRIYQKKVEIFIRDVWRINNDVVQRNRPHEPSGRPGGHRRRTVTGAVDRPRLVIEEMPEEVNVERIMENAKNQVARVEDITVREMTLPEVRLVDTRYPNYENQAAQTPTPKPLPQPAYQAAYQQPQPSVSQWKIPQQPANNAVSAANNSGALWERQSGSPRRDDEPWRGHGEQTERGEPDHEGSDNGSSRSRTSKCNESDGRRERSPARGRDYRDSRRDDNRDSRRDDNRGFRRDEDTGHRTRMGTPTKRPYSEISQGSKSFGNDPDNSSFSMSNAGIFNKQPVADASKRSRFDQIDKRSISQRQRHTRSSARAADKENIPVEINIQGTQNLEVMPPLSTQEHNLNIMLQQAGLADVVQEPVTPRPPDVEPRTSDAQRAREGRSSETPLGSLDRTKVSLGDTDKTTDSQRFINEEWGTRGTMLKIFRCALVGVPNITVELLVQRGPVLEGSRRRIAARCFTSILKLSSQRFIKIIKDADTNEIKHIELGPRIPLPGRN